MDLFMETVQEMNSGNLNLSSDCIVYSPHKYRETEGSKDIGTNFWNQGRTEEIKERVLHLDEN